MITNRKQHIEIVKSAMQYARGDDLYRAECAFRGMSEKQLEEKHGNSGLTRKQTLDLYRLCDAKWKEANDWIEKLIEASPDQL